MHTNNTKWLSKLIIQNNNVCIQNLKVIIQNKNLKLTDA